MQSKQTMKRLGLVALLALILATASSTMAAPPVLEPESVACGDSAYCSTAGSAVYVQNIGTGPTIYGYNTSTGEGLKGRGNPGVYGFSYFAAGVRGKSNAGVGVKGESVNKYGVEGASNNNIGVRGSGPTGVYGESGAYDGEGVHGHGTNILTEGVLGTSDQNVGVWGISSGTSGNNIGVWGTTAGTWGFFSNESIQVNGCTGCTISFVGLNVDGQALEVGDIVSISGVAAPLIGQQIPVMEVQRAANPDSGALAVVQSRAQVTTGQSRIPEGNHSQREAVEIPGLADGPAAPGEYLFIMVQGPTQVRTAPGSAIQPGTLLTAGAGGFAVPATNEGQTIGRALDYADPDTGLVWVLVDVQ